MPNSAAFADSASICRLETPVTGRCRRHVVVHGRDGEVGTRRTGRPWSRSRRTPAGWSPRAPGAVPRTGGWASRRPDPPRGVPQTFSASVCGISEVSLRCPPAWVVPNTGTWYQYTLRREHSTTTSSDTRRRQRRGCARPRGRDPGRHRSWSARAWRRVTHATGYTRSTTHRLLQAMEAHDLLDYSGARGYHLGPRFLRLRTARCESSRSETSRIPAPRASATATGESAQLYVRSVDERVCIDAVESPSELRTIVPWCRASAHQG